MNIEERNEENKALTGFRGSMDLFMGALYVAVSIYAFNFPSAIEQFGKFPVGMFCGLFGLYGLFRIGRGALAMRNMLKRRK